MRDAYSLISALIHIVYDNMFFESLLFIIVCLYVFLCLAGCHSNMFQHGIRIFLDDYIPIESLDTAEEEAQREYMEDFYYWMRTVWQHIVAHYVSGEEMLCVMSMLI